MSTPSSLQTWQVSSSKVIHKTPWIEIVEDTCLAAGQELIYTYTRRVDEGPLIIAEENDGSIWLVRQYRHPIKKILWQFPVEGKLPSESWQAAAERGLREEIKLDAQNWQDLGEFFPDPGGLQQKYRAYLAQNLSPAQNTESFHLDGEVEELEINRFSRAEIDRLIDLGELADNWTLAGLFLYDRAKRA
jgi:ADP-ribose pyrophosphatase